MGRGHVRGLWAALGLLAGCGDAGRGAGPLVTGPAPLAPASSAQAPPSLPGEDGAALAGGSAVLGTVGGRPLSVKSAIFMWREKANDMQIVLSDMDNVCEALTAGGWPKGATVLYMTLKHNTAESRDAPFSAGEYGIRTAGARARQDTKGATFMHLDAACSPLASAKATSGVVRLSTPEVKVGGTAEGSFELTMGDGGDKLVGRFAAAFCQQPDMEPHGCR